MPIERGPRPAATRSRLASGLPQATGSAILRAKDKNGAAMRNLLIVIAALLALAGLVWAYWPSEFDAGIAAYNSGDLDTAIADFTKAIKLKPDDAKAYNNRGLAYDEKGLYDQAIADYTEAIKLKQDVAVAYNNRGLAYSGTMLYDQAVADYTKAIELKPDDAPTGTAASRMMRRGSTIRPSPIIPRRSSSSWIMLRPSTTVASSTRSWDSVTRRSRTSGKPDHSTPV